MGFVRVPILMQRAFAAYLAHVTRPRWRGSCLPAELRFEAGTPDGFACLHGTNPIRLTVTHCGGDAAPADRAERSRRSPTIPVRVRSRAGLVDHKSRKCPLPIVDDTAAWSKASSARPWQATGVRVWPLDCKPVATKPVVELSLIHCCLASLRQGSSFDT